MDYIIASTAVTDEIRFADGKTVEKTAGGAGMYALCGMKLWTDDIRLVTGVGGDFAGLYGKWFRDNQITMDGLLVKDANTPHTVVRYFKDGEREETPRYGLDHYRKIEVTPEELRPYFQRAKGIYIFKNSNPDFWNRVIPMKQASKAVLMWEIGCDATYYENLSRVKEIARQVDIFSINLTESRQLLGKQELTELVAEFRSWKMPLVFLRMGAKGAVMITKETAEHVPAEEHVQVIDPTGGGNSSSGAVLYGFTEGYPPHVCAKMGNLSAAMCIAQYGVPNIINEDRRKEALKRVKEYQDVK